MPLTGPPPPEPDLIAERGTDQWRDAVHAKKSWIAQQIARGATLDDLVNAGVMDKYGEEGSSRAGRKSHDYEYWEKALRGESLGDEGLPSELGEANWDVGNFRRQVANEDFTEWPPGSGKFFNDPANDPTKRQWFNQYGDPAAPPADGGPQIDYNAVNGGFGGSIRAYLASQAQYKEAEAKAKPITSGGPTPAQPIPNTQPIADATTPNNNVFNTKPSATTPQPQTNAQSAMMGDMNNNPSLPSRFKPNPAMTGNYTGESSFGTGLHTPRNPTGSQTRRKFGTGWYSTWG